jgi:hypothetical protein
MYSVLQAAISLAWPSLNSVITWRSKSAFTRPMPGVAIQCESPPVPSTATRCGQAALRM